MKLSAIQTVILCGGAGTRLWPLSRELFPKQLLSLIDDKSLLQNTAIRSFAISNTTPLLVCNEEHRFLVAEQMRQLGETQVNILLEPCARNTAPAVAIAAFLAMAQGDDPVLLVLPSDHAIRDMAAFKCAAEKAIHLAELGHLVTFGILPDRAETGYGYIEQGNALAEGFSVAKFVEKPDALRAQTYCDSGRFFWNSGMFVFKASVYLHELAKLNPLMHDCCLDAVKLAKSDLDFVRIDKQRFADCPSDSIDYAVMEKTTLAAMVPLSCGWSDIGSFSALWDELPKDTEHNAKHGDVIAVDSHRCLLHAQSRLLATVGVTDMVVIETQDAVLVAHKDAVQNVKKIVDQLKMKGRAETNTHRKVYRPWGYYEGVDTGDRYQVKRIGVKPGASLSLQMHYHRAEHWIVVSGTAEVTRNDDTYLVSENESTFIPLGHKHRLHNPGKTWLEMIEVQSGSYLGEDDIVRFDDKYGRS